MVRYDLLESNDWRIAKQEKAVKNSNRDFVHQFRSSIVCGSHLPLAIETKNGSDVAKQSMEPDSKEAPGGFVLSGTLDKWRLSEESDWPEAPHIVFANLLVEDPKAVVAFTKRYGVLKDSFLSKDPEELEAANYLRQYGPPFKSPPPETFNIDSALLEQSQEELRGAWDNDWGLHRAYVGLLREQIEFGTKVHVMPPGKVVLQTVDPWTFICFLFVRDLMESRLGFCGNPDCPAPYFRKKRKTQKYCEQGPCVQYAQRQYSLDWWNRKGKKIREKKAKARRAKSKQ
jgi:hypothetical protein